MSQYAESRQIFSTATGKRRVLSIATNSKEYSINKDDSTTDFIEQSIKENNNIFSAGVKLKKFNQTHQFRNYARATAIGATRQKMQAKLDMNYGEDESTTTQYVLNQRSRDAEQHIPSAQSRYMVSERAFQLKKKKIYHKTLKPLESSKPLSINIVQSTKNQDIEKRKVRIKQILSTKHSTNPQINILNGGVTNLLKFKEPRKMSERQSALLQQQDERNKFIKKSQDITKAIRKKYNEHLTQSQAHQSQQELVVEHSFDQSFFDVQQNPFNSQNISKNDLKLSTVTSLNISKQDEVIPSPMAVQVPEPKKPKNKTIPKFQLGSKINEYYNRSIEKVAPKFSEVLFTKNHLEKMIKGPYLPNEMHKNTRNFMEPIEDPASIRLKQDFFDEVIQMKRRDSLTNPLNTIIKTTRSYEEDGINPICDRLTKEIILGHQSSRDHVFQYEKTKKVDIKYKLEYNNSLYEGSVIEEYEQEAINNIPVPKFANCSLFQNSVVVESPKKLQPGFGLSRMSTRSKKAEYYNVQNSIDSLDMKRNQDVISTISQQFLIDQQRLPQNLKKYLPMISPLTQLENEFLVITNDLIETEAKKNLLAQNNIDGTVKPVNDRVMTEKMKEVIKLSKQLKYNAKKLIMKEDDFHIIIHGKELTEDFNGPLQSGPPLDIEFLPDIQFYFKVDIVEGTESPITIKLDGETNQMIVRGSFHHKLPSITENEMYLKNPSRILIKDPHGNKKFQATTHFFLNISTSQPDPVPITIKCYKRSPVVKSKKTNITEEPENENAEEQQPKKDGPKLYGIAKMRAKLKETINEAINQRGMRYQVLEKMKELQKKKKIINFLKMQFGSENPYHLKEEVVHLQELPFDPQGIVLDQKIQDNIINTNRPEVYVLPESNAQEIKLQNEMDFITKSKENIERWQKFRIQKAIVINEYLKVKKKQAIITKYNKMIKLDQILTKIWETFYERVKTLLARRKMLFYLKTSMAGFKRRQKRQGVTMDVRFERLLKNCYTFYSLNTKEFHEQKAKETLKQILIATSNIDVLRQSLQQHQKRVLFIQRRYRSQRSIFEIRVEAMKKLWSDQVMALTFKCRNHNVSKEVKNFLTKCLKVPDDIKEACFRRYLNGALNTHALAYLAYRQKILKSAQLITAFLEKKNYLQAQKQKLIQVMEMTRPESICSSEMDSSCRASSPDCQNIDHIKKHTHCSKYNQEPDMSMDAILKIRDLRKDIWEQDQQEPKDAFEEMISEQTPSHKVIHRFEDINLFDPFPSGGGAAKPNKKKPKRFKTSKKLITEKDLFAPTPDLDDYDFSIYPSSETVPVMIYIPSRNVMHKLMKLCCSVKDYTDIFYFM